MCTTCFKNQKFYFWGGGFRMILRTNGYYFLKRIKQLIFVMVKCGVFYEVWTEFVNSIYTRLGFKGLNAQNLYCSDAESRPDMIKTFIYQKQSC
jgi:hypothetical protein